MTDSDIDTARRDPSCRSSERLLVMSCQAGLYNSRDPRNCAQAEQSIRTKRNTAMESLSGRELRIEDLGDCVPFRDMRQERITG
jgi:hypothetical protein